jgi:mutator protein MutT
MDLLIQVTTLCMIRKENSILLAKKKRRFGEGKWNGYGGKVDTGESIEQALVREMKEESGIDIVTFEKRGEMIFNFKDTVRIVHLYEIMEYSGEEVETEEMVPQWFTLENIPYDEMWTSDKIWYPLFLERKYFTGEGYFDEDYNLISFQIT